MCRGESFRNDGKGKAEVTVDYDKMETLLAKELNIEVKDKDIENIEDLGSAVDGLSKIGSGRKLC